MRPPSYLYGDDAQDDDERRKLLRSNGPQINVYVSNPFSAKFNMPSAKVSKSTRALIDTGASINSISVSVAQAIGLMQIDERDIIQVSGSTRLPVYQGQVYVPEIEDTILGEFYGGQPGSSSNGYQVLLGRPFLENYIFSYDGPKGYFTLTKHDSSDDWKNII